MNLPKITSAMLVVTHACPLACRYCFVKQEPSKMTLQTAMDAAQFLIKNAEESGAIPDINFFGGEPMLMWDEIIVPLTNWIRNEYQKPFSLGITTNGVLLTPERLNYLKENNIGFLLSIDGAKETQDYNRPFHNGKSSFDIIEPLIPQILEINPIVTFRMTAIPATCNYIFDNIQYAINKGFNNFFIIPNYFEHWDQEHRKILVKEMHKYTEYYIETCRAGKHPITFSIFENCFKDIKKINHAITEKTYRSNCGACTKCGLGSSIFASIHPNGNIFSCQEMTSNEGNDSLFCIGNIYTGIDENKRIALVEKFDNEPVQGDECKTCKYNRICSGECVAQNYFINNDIHLMPEMNCWWKRFLLEEAIYVANVLGKEKNEIFIQRWDNAK